MKNLEKVSRSLDGVTPGYSAEDLERGKIKPSNAQGVYDREIKKIKDVRYRKIKNADRIANKADRLLAQTLIEAEYSYGIETAKYKKEVAEAKAKHAGA